jgi:hypothetical protein
MEKLIIILVIVVPTISFAQWSGSTDMTTPSKVGVGVSGVPLTRLQIVDSDAGGPGNTTTPSRGVSIGGTGTSGLLNIGVDATVTPFYSWLQSRNKSSAAYYNLAINPWGGNVGVGTSAPESKLHVKSNGSNDFTLESSGTGTRYNRLIFKDGSMNAYVWLAPETSTLAIGNGSHEHISMRLDNNRVGIGTRNPDAKLTVLGDIHANEVRVDLNMPAPDYVFENDYDLSSLEEVEEYISQYKHLPEVPSAEEIQEEGINVGEMNMILLRKVEELTLYLIETQKKNEALEERLKALEKK